MKILSQPIKYIKNNSAINKVFNPKSGKTLASGAFQKPPVSYLEPELQSLLDIYKQKYNFKKQKPLQWALKRTMDYAGASLGLVLTSPIMMIEAIAIKLESKGPVLFKQKRIGKDGKPFTIYKFRTMYNDAPQTYFKLDEASQYRVTKVGKFIRKYSIDELPQFINILKGDMSLIGPRPTVSADKLMIEVDKNSVKRYAVRPGAKLDYKCLKDDDVISKIQTEKEYLGNWNLVKDIKILGCIIKDMVTGNNR